MVFLVDRKKELIKVKGLQVLFFSWTDFSSIPKSSKVAPAELENHIRGLEGVTDVAVIGVDHARAGEVPRAYVVKGREGLTEEDVKVNPRDINPLLIFVTESCCRRPLPAQALGRRGRVRRSDSQVGRWQDPEEGPQSFLSAEYQWSIRVKALPILAHYLLLLYFKVKLIFSESLISLITGVTDSHWLFTYIAIAYTRFLHNTRFYIICHRCKYININCSNIHSPTLATNLVSLYWCISCPHPLRWPYIALLLPACGACRCLAFKPFKRTRKTMGGGWESSAASRKQNFG